MPYTSIAPGANGLPTYITSSVTTNSPGDYFEVLRNDVFVASNYPPTAGVGVNGWVVDGGERNVYDSGIAVPLDVIYAPDDIFELRSYQLPPNNPYQASREIYRFQIDGAGNGGSSGETMPPDCITISNDVGEVALRGAEAMRVTPPPFGSLCYQTTQGGKTYSQWFDGTWKITVPSGVDDGTGSI